MDESDRTMTHDRARQLVYAERIEGISSADGEWLQHHLAECGDCRAVAAGVDKALRDLRLAPVAASASVVMQTQSLVAARAAELRHQRAATLPLRIVAALAAVISIISTPVAWKAFAWLGGLLSASPTASGVAFLLFWITPAIAAAVLLMGLGSHRGLWTSSGAGN